MPTVICFNGCPANLAEAFRLEVIQMSIGVSELMPLDTDDYNEYSNQEVTAFLTRIENLISARKLAALLDSADDGIFLRDLMSSPQIGTPSVIVVDWRPAAEIGILYECLNQFMDTCKSNHQFVHLLPKIFEGVPLEKWHRIDPEFPQDMSHFRGTPLWAFSRENLVVLEAA